MNAHILQVLGASAEISAITTNIIYGELPEKASLPAITFEFVTEQPSNSLRGDTGDARQTWTINAWARDGTTADQLDAAIRSAMRGHVRTARIPLHSPEEKYFRWANDYRIKKTG